MYDTSCPSCECGISLGRSTYVYIDGRLLKSCCTCSRLAGEHVFHTIARFGRHHTRLLADGSPSIQSHCIASFSARHHLGIEVLAPDYAERMLSELTTIEGPRCHEVRGDEPPRFATDSAILELLALEGDDDGTPCRPRRRETRGTVKLTLVAVGFDPARAPRDYQMADSYELGERVWHPTFGFGVVITAEAGRIRVLFEVGERLLVHRYPVRVIVLQEIAA